MNSLTKAICSLGNLHCNSGLLATPLNLHFHTILTSYIRNHRILQLSPQTANARHITPNTPTSAKKHNMAPYTLLRSSSNIPNTGPPHSTNAETFPQIAFPSFFPPKPKQNFHANVITPFQLGNNNAVQGRHIVVCPVPRVTCPAITV